MNKTEAGVLIVLVSGVFLMVVCLASLGVQEQKIKADLEIARMQYLEHGN
jgi:hypothetical protein